MSHTKNGRKRRNLLEGSGYKSLRPTILISEKDYDILARYVAAENNEHKADCEKNGFSFEPFSRDLLIGTLIHQALRIWDQGQQAIEAAQTPAAPTPAVPAPLDELREVAPFGTRPPSWIDDIQVEGA